MREWELHYITTGYSGRIQVTEFGKPLAPKEYPYSFKVVEKSAYDERDGHAKEFCRLYNAALDTIVELKKRLGEDPGDY
jgi:hypothetical protein